MAQERHGTRQRMEMRSWWAAIVADKDDVQAKLGAVIGWGR